MITQRLTRNLFTGTTEPLTAPLSRDFTEDLGDGRTETFLNKFQDAAAAYSLRALGTYNDPVVEVRRDVDNAERSFTAGQVQGELENWVNGKLETTLPCDHITTIEVSGINTGSDGADGTYTLTAPLRWDGPNGHVIIRNTGTGLDPYEANTRWLLVDADDLFVAIFSNPCDESVLPFDATWSTGTFTNPNAAAAAYSLRKVRNDYAGDAVQIRRASDNVEVNVAFDSNDEVSDSSAITNVTESPDAGDTTATTLGAFLTEESDILDEQNFSSDTGAFLGFGATLTFDNDSVSDGSVSKDDCLEVELTSASNAYVRDTGANLYSGINNVKIRFEADFYAPSTNTSAVSVRLQNTFEEINGGGSQVFFPTTKGAWTSVSVEGYPNQNALQLLVLDRTVGDVYYFANMKISIIGDNGTVVTWYDQSGDGNDATQPTTSLQPLIAEGGNYLGHIDWNGGSLLKTNSGFDVTYGSGETDFSAFWVSTPDTTAVDAGLISGTGGFLAKWESDNRGGFRILDAANATAGVSGSAGTLGSAFILSDDTRKGFVNGSISIDSTGTSTYRLNEIHLGFRGSTGYGRTYKMKEVIIYSSDQSDNRFKIESNINNYYGIYNTGDQLTLPTAENYSGTLTNASSTGGTLSHTGTAYIGWELPEVLNLGARVFVSFDLTIDSGSAGVIIAGLSNTVSGSGRTEYIDVNASGSYAFPLTVNADGATHFRLKSQTGTYQFTVSNLRIIEGGYDGFVETWYDQSGNGRHAVQAATGDQPQIVKAGSYLGEIDFDGVNDFLQTESNFDAFGANSLSFFTVFNPSDLSGNPRFLNTRVGTAGVEFIVPPDPRLYYKDSAGNGTNGNLQNASLSADTEVLYTNIVDRDTDQALEAFKNGSSLTVSNPTDLTGVGSVNSAELTIGANNAGFQPYNGKTKEIIIYSSNQSANRTAIESNIADEYGITLS